MWNHEITIEQLEKSIQEIALHIKLENRTEAEKDPLFIFLKDKVKWFEDPECFDIFVKNKFEEIISAILCRTNINNEMVRSIYLDWSFYELNVTRLCEKLFGRAFSADRSTSILKSAMKFQLTGIMTTYNAENYWHPKVGTFLQWMELVKGLYRMKCGWPDLFIKAYEALLLANNPMPPRRPPFKFIF